MSFSHIVEVGVNAGDGQIPSTNTYTGSGRISINETVADSVTDGLIVVPTIDVSAVKSFILLSDQDVLIETNSGSAADDSISLLAGVPYVWNTDSYDAFLLTVDVTALYVTNASGAAALIRMEALVDATP
jgi:hypothetical protein